MSLVLSDLEHIGTLGVGTFSRVKMVKIKGTTEVPPGGCTTVFSDLIS
jgi:hypothetical protein